MNTYSRKEQHYAVNGEGLLVHISEAYLKKEDFFCPHCKCRMLKKCGKHRKWHFAHDYRFANNEQIVNCSYESYLHSFAKLRFKQWFDSSDKIILYYKQRNVCSIQDKCKWTQNAPHKCRKYEKRALNLKEYVDQCLVEENINFGGKQFRADLLLINSVSSKNKILIEVKVTHECTEKKKTSGGRIIEFEVHSEEDVERIVENGIEENDAVKYYGFKYGERLKDNMYSSDFEFMKFRLDKNNRVLPFIPCTCRDYSNRQGNTKLEITAKFDLDSALFDNRCYIHNYSYPEVYKGEFYVWCLAYALGLHCDIRDCSLCYNHNYSYMDSCHYCKLKRKKIEIKEAVTCSYFSLNKAQCNALKKKLERYANWNYVDVWTNNEN